jgi:CBS domain-containing protein
VTTPDQTTFLARLPPFNRLSATELELIARELTVDCYPAGEVLVKAGETPACLYIIIEGAVYEVDSDPSALGQGDPATSGNAPLWCVVSLYAAEDTFDARALLEGASQHYFVVSEPTRCFLLPRPAFLRAVQNHSALATFYDQKISQRLATLRETGDNRDLSSFTLAKIQDAYIHPPVFVDAGSSIYDAALTMKEHKTNSVLVQDGDELGIVTATDLREAAIIQRRSIDEPVGPLATYELISMEPSDFLFNALLRMTHYNINRLVIREGRTLHGILEQIDLLSYLSNHSHLIALQIERAQSREDLKRAGQDLVNVIRDLHAKGIKIRYIMQLVSELNKKLLRKLFDLLAPPELVADVCLLVLGSEGRQEQVLKTDQDNALILRDGVTHLDLERITGEFIEGLIDFGYPRCPGNIMVSNPYWTKSVAAFKDELFQWIVHPTQDSFLQFAIFFDAMAVAGDDNLLRHVKDHMYRLLGDHRAFYAQFAKATVAFETPIGFFTNFVVEKHRDELDLKKGGIFPIVHGIRSLALEYRLPQTNTVDRIMALSQRNLFRSSFGIELIEVFTYLSTLRVKAGLNKIQQGLPQDNYLNPKELNKLERELLRDSFKIVNEFKKFITYHFKLGMIS